MQPRFRTWMVHDLIHLSSLARSKQKDRNYSFQSAHTGCSWVVRDGRWSKSLSGARWRGLSAWIMPSVFASTAARIHSRASSTTRSTQPTAARCAQFQLFTSYCGATSALKRRSSTKGTAQGATQRRQKRTDANFSTFWWPDWSIRYKLVLNIEAVKPIKTMLLMILVVNLEENQGEMVGWRKFFNYLNHRLSKVAKDGIFSQGNSSTQSNAKHNDKGPIRAVKICQFASQVERSLHWSYNSAFECLRYLLCRDVSNCENVIAFGAPRLSDYFFASSSCSYWKQLTLQRNNWGILPPSYLLEIQCVSLCA